MNKIFTLAFSILFTLTAFGQRLEYERSSNWFFGLNAGATWNTTDVQNKTYAGWGFLLGKSFNYDYGRRISYDLRLRYLRGKWYGQDTDSTNLSSLGADYNGALSQYKEGLGYTVNNFEANVHELGLELAIHFNRFRDRTGWDPYIFGGANISWNETYGDLINQDVFLAGDSSTYAYDQIDMIKPAIEFALDENYETALDGTSPNRFNVNFMPSLGVGIGYDFGPRFQMGIEHKTTFALKDDFDGYVDAEPNWGFLENDVYHYTSAFLRWRFRTGGSSRPVRPQPVDPVVTPVTGGGAAPCQRPDVRVFRPLQRTETVLAANYVYKAEVRFVQSRNQITMRVNGVETTNFLYNPQTHELESYLYLQPGNNTIEVIGRNTCGTDSETSTLIYNDCIDPVVYFQNVCTSTFTAEVDQRSYTVQAQISNSTNIEFMVNGVRITNFTYNSATGDFRSNILLNQGQNTIRITATNGCGTDVGTSVVTYTDCPDPIVNFTNGNSGFISVSQPNFNLNAYIYNVTNQNNISLRLNNSNINFSFNSSTNLLTASLSLNPGQNTIVITSTTSCGTDTETLTVEYTPCMTPNIQLLTPNAQSTTTANGTQSIQASIYNVANINQIQLYVNGNLQPGGSFNPVTHMFGANVALNEGFNTIQITVLNDCGSDTETISVNYNPCSTPDVQMILPSASGGLTSSPSQLVQVVVFNVTNISEIQTYVNGTVQNGGTFDVSNGLYQNTVALTLGVNTIQVVATNACGSDVQTTTITYRACEAPQITMTSPTSDPFFTSAASMDVSAMIANVTNTSQVQLTVNGVADASGASFNTSSLTYTNNVNLSAGNNTITISATNNCGTVSKQITVIREVINIPVDDIDSITICFVHCNNVGEPVTMTIPLSQWPSYQSQGAQLGPCPIVVEPVDLPMTICFKDHGSAPATMTILTSEWPAYQALGATQGPCPDPTMVVCFNGNQLTIPTSQLSAYQAQGATEGPCPIEQEETVVICANGTETTILVSEWPAYQLEGATLGPCPVIDPEMVICIEGTERTILTSQWPTYQAQGATQGPCPVVDPQITICLKGTEMSILTSQLPTYQAQGAVVGPCPTVDPDITICLNGTEQTIPTSQWAAYQAQGATQGPCPVEEETITICVGGNELTIPVSQWQAYQVEGATLGPCPTVDPEITICLNGVEKTIVTSDWPKYQSQGATQGPCPTVDPQITICLKGTEMTILTSQFSKYQSQGATLGPCPTVDPQMTICLNGATKTILVSEWAKYQSKGATIGACPDAKMTICYNGRTIEIDTDDWSRYQTLGATAGACLDNPIDTGVGVGNQGVGNSDTLNGNVGRPDTGGGNDDELLFGNRTITICHTPQGSIASQTIQIPLNEWEQYQSLGATLGACTGSLNPTNGGGNIDVNNTGIGNGDGVGNVPINPNGNNGTNTTGGNMPVVGNGSQAAKDELIRKQKEEAARLKAEQEEAARKAAAAKKEAAEKERQIQLQKEKEAELKAAQEEAKRKAAAEKARQDKAAKDAAAQKAEAAKQKAAQEAAAAKARQEQAAKDAAARRQAEEAKRKAAQEAAAAKARQEKAARDAAARKKAEEAKRKAAQEAAAAKARQEKAARDAEARRKAEEAKRKAAQQAEAKRKADAAKQKAAQEAAAAKARQEKAARDAAAKKKAEEDAKRKAAAKKAADEAAKKKAEEQRKAKEREGGR
ncbi:MAG: hypothetical protein P8P74_13530 [Crocinitomicaceae bacterium]|nr:hypothetical protein [Crocinitomicaceae bacterium]